MTVNSTSPPLKIAACFSDEKLCCAGISIVSHGGGLAVVLNICHIRLRSHQGWCLNTTAVPLPLKTLPCQIMSGRSMHSLPRFQTGRQDGQCHCHLSAAGPRESHPVPAARACSCALSIEVTDGAEPPLPACSTSVFSPHITQLCWAGERKRQRVVVKITLFIA